MKYKKEKTTAYKRELVMSSAELRDDAGGRRLFQGYFNQGTLTSSTITLWCHWVDLMW